MSANPYASPRAECVAPATDDRNRRRLQVLRWLAASEFLFFLTPALILALYCVIARQSPLETFGRDGPPGVVALVYAFRLLVSYATYTAASRALARGSHRAAWTTAVLASVPYVSPWGFVGLPVGWALCFSLRRAPQGTTHAPA